MAINTYVNESGETCFRVYVNIRSKTHPALRTQRKSLGLKTQREAEREEIKLIRECEREILKRESLGSTWGVVVEAFEGHLASAHEQALHETTRADYVATIRKHTEMWWKRSATQVTKVELRELFAQLKAQGRSVSHLKKMKIIINKIFVYGIDSGMIRGMDTSPTVGIQLGSEVEKKPEILTINEIRKLLQEARKLQHLWYPVWAMALLTGMRSGELYALLWTDIDWVNNSITVSKSYNGRLKCIKSTKAGYWRTVPISSELKALLLELKKGAGDRPSVLPRMWKWTLGFQAEELRQFCIGLGLTSVRFHALRACFATQLIRNGVPPIQIQKICGWRDLKTMQRYIRLAGIEIEGATEGLKILPELEFAAKTADLFVNGSVA